MKELSLICHILDPRFKNQMIEQQSEKSRGTKAIEALIKKYRTQTNSQNSQTSQAEPPKKTTFDS